MTEALLNNDVLQFLPVEGAEIAYDYNCSSAHPSHLLILINGYQRNRLDFRAFRKKLAKLAPHVATIALDNRHCGETKIHTLQPLTMKQMAHDVVALATLYQQKLNLQSFSVLGISMGGMIAQTLASQLPPGVLEVLCLVSTTAGGAERTWPNGAVEPTKLHYVNKNVDLESTQKNMKRYFGSRFLQNSPLLFEMMCKNIFKSTQHSTSNEDAQIQFIPSSQFNGVDALTHIRAKKTVVFSGDEDHVIPIENSYFLSEHILRSELVVYPKVGHLILIEEPEKFAQDLADLFPA